MPFRLIGGDFNGRATSLLWDSLLWDSLLQLRDRCLRALRRGLSSGDKSMRLDVDLVLRRPLSAGLKELIRLLVLRSALSGELTDAGDTERLARFSCPPLPRNGDLSCSIRLGDRDRDGERFVDMVEMESSEYDETDRECLRVELRPDFLPRSSSFFANISSATPFFRSKSFGTSVVSLGFSWGLRSCCVREGRDL